MPGGVTATEIQAALERGLTTLKFFPARASGGVEEDLATAVEYGAAHGALAMTTPGDTTMATRAEVVKLARGGGARVDR